MPICRLSQLGRGKHLAAGRGGSAAQHPASPAAWRRDRPAQLPGPPYRRCRLHAAAAAAAAAARIGAAALQQHQALHRPAAAAARARTAALRQPLHQSPRAQGSNPLPAPSAAMRPEPPDSCAAILGSAPLAAAPAPTARCHRRPHRCRCLSPLCSCWPRPPAAHKVAADAVIQRSDHAVIQRSDHPYAGMLAAAAAFQMQLSSDCGWSIVAHRQYPDPMLSRRRAADCKTQNHLGGGHGRCSLAGNRWPASSRHRRHRRTLPSRRWRRSCPGCRRKALALLPLGPRRCCSRRDGRPTCTLGCRHLTRWSCQPLRRCH